MDDARALRSFGAVRVAVGLAFAVAPGLVLRRWFGAGPVTPAQELVGRMFGVRDALLGVGTVLAVQDGHHLRRWALLGAVADGTDALFSLATLRTIKGPGLVGSAVSGALAAAAGARLASRLR